MMYLVYTDDIDEWFAENAKKNGYTSMVFPEIIHETKNNVYIGKLPDGTKEIDILKPNHGDKYDLEKGLLYYIIKHNMDLGKVLEWMRPILDETQRPENIEKHKKKIESRINNWFSLKNSEPINDKECQKIINNRTFFIENQRFVVEVCIKENGIVNIYDKENKTNINMIKSGFPQRGFLRYLIEEFYCAGMPTVEYYQLKKLTYKFYKGCFDSVEKYWE